MIRRLFRLGSQSSLPSFRAQFYLEGIQYAIEVVPRAMIVCLNHLDRYSIEMPFHVDDVEKTALPIPPVNFPAILKDAEVEEDANDVTASLAKLVAQHLFCPKCGRCADEKDGFDDNDTPNHSYRHALRCLGCHHQWDPNS